MFLFEKVQKFGVSLVFNASVFTNIPEPFLSMAGLCASKKLVQKGGGDPESGIRSMALVE